MKERLLKCTEIDGRTDNNDLDGGNQLDDLSGKTDKSPRNEFWYVNDEGQRHGRPPWGRKVTFLKNRLKYPPGRPVNHA